MPLVRVHAYDFVPDLPGFTPARSYQDVQFSWDELLTAIVTVGKSRADDLRTRTGVEECRRELLWRVSLLRMALTEAGGRFVQSGSYLRLDPSEKVGISYMLGLMATNALCLRYLSMPFLMHLDVYASSPARPSAYSVTSEWLETLRSSYGLPHESDSTKLQSLIESVASSLSLPVAGEGASNGRRVQREVCRIIFGSTYTGLPSYPGKLAHFWSFLTRLVRNARPDLFGVELDSGGSLVRCVIAEAKGRSGKTYSDDRVDCKSSPPPTPPHKLNRRHGEAMLQALSRSHVNGVPVGRHLAVFAHFEKSSAGTEALHFSWKDPSGDGLKPKERRKVPLGPMIVDYYASLMALGCSDPAPESTADLAHLSKCPAKFAPEDAGFAVEFHPGLHAVLERFFQDKSQMFAEAETFPALLSELEAKNEIGKGTEFSINGVRIFEKGERGNGPGLPGPPKRR